MVKVRKSYFFNIKAKQRLLCLKTEYICLSFQSLMPLGVIFKIFEELKQSIRTTLRTRLSVNYEKYQEDIRDFRTLKEINFARD